MKFGSFEQLEKLTEGPITTVYKAYQPHLDRVVLLKVLHPHLKDEAELVARFQREAQACARIKHENIVDVYELGRESESWFIAMEYIDGWSFKTYLTEKGSLPVEEADLIMADCLRGLAAAHANGVLHRDIKPSNILLDPDGKAKLTDFGLASIVGASSLTQPETAVGTPAYISPEQLNGEKLDGRADLFSLGAVYYEMLTGQQLFAGETFTDSFTKVLTLPVPEIAEVQPGTNRILQKLLAKSRGQRFESALAVLNEFGQDLTLIRTPKTVLNAGKQYKWVAGLVLILVLLAVGYFTLNDFRSRQNSNQPDAFVHNEGIAADISTGSGNFSAAIIDSLSDPIETEEPDHNTIKTAKPILLPEEDEPQAELQLSASLTDSQSIPGESTPPDSGSLIITCRPWAHVRIDGQSMGMTPLPEPILLVVGRHNLSFENPNFPRVTRQIVVEANKMAAWHEDLWQSVGYLWLTVVPWADVYLNQKKVTTTPISEPLMQPVGQYKLELVHPMHALQDKEISIQAGDTTFVFCRLGQEIVVR